ncbi:MAG TPA: hypothetical protein VGR35_03680 [Tepidisphaeraceae bacterium]|nr:hypothetical protein [Tepidisphaeraceae bacterium]
MTRRDLSLTIALCASLVAHGVLALVTFEGAARQLETVQFPPFPRQPADMMRLAPPDTVKLGGATDGGVASNAAPGEEPLFAKEGSADQARLSRDPRGLGRIGELPSESLVPQTDGKVVTNARGAVVEDRRPVLPVATDSPRPFGAAPDTVAAFATVPRALRSKLTPLPDPAQARGSKAAADPAVMSASESDAFATLGGIEFRDGRIDSRLGRAFKSVRPRLSLPAQIELMSLADKRIVLKIAIDATGRVRSVDVLHSTGSNLIDQPVKLVLYEWWFEPSIGADGQATADTIVLPIRWH